jgi:hypothetical protein
LNGRFLSFLRQNLEPILRSSDTFMILRHLQSLSGESWELKKFIGGVFMPFGHRVSQKSKALGFALFTAVSAFSMDELHPTFSIQHILPSQMNSIGGIGGIDLLPNGDGVICTWGGSQKSMGEVWIVPALNTGTPGSPTRISTGLREPLGVKVVDGDFYVLEKSRINKFTGSGTTWTKSTLWSLPTAWYDDAQWHHFSFDLNYRDDAFWFTTGTAYDYTANDPLQRGALIKVPKNGGSFTQLARGLRNPDGLGIGPDDEFFVSENQGHWKPINYLYHIPTEDVPTNGRFYGFRTNGNNACGTQEPAVDNSSCPNDPEYPPAIWLPYGNYSNSPTRPMLLKHGPYKGQMISGDVFKGGTLRYFIERVNGEYQGAAFTMMTPGPDGVNFGIHQFRYAADSSILVAGIGGGTCNLGGSGNWAWSGTCRGLDLLKPTAVVPFDIKAIRSKKDGFEIEFTKPAGTAANTASNYQLRTTVTTARLNYGVDGSTTDNNVAVNVTEAKLSADGLFAELKTASLLTRRMYAFTLNNNIKSATNENLYTNVGYYTLNTVNTTNVAQADRAKSFKQVQAKTQLGKLSLELPFQEPYQVSVFDVSGHKVAHLNAQQPQTLTTGVLNAGIYLVSGKVGESEIRQKVRVD